MITHTGIRVGFRRDVRGVEQDLGARVAVAAAGVLSAIALRRCGAVGQRERRQPSFRARTRVRSWKRDRRTRPRGRLGRVRVRPLHDRRDQATCRGPALPSPPASTRRPTIGRSSTWATARDRAFGRRLQPLPRRPEIWRRPRYPHPLGPAGERWPHAAVRRGCRRSRSATGRPMSASRAMASSCRVSTRTASRWRR